jgi:response regulator of citrate/malate metabolism
MSGVDVLESLRADPVTAAIPVVAVSADATADQIHHVRASGVADYVTKPFEVPRLLAVIDSFAAREPVAPAVDEDLVLDQRRVAELVGLDADGATFRSLVAVALEEAADQIAAIGDVPGAGQDSAAVRAAAHGLKSSAGIVGARRLASLADAIEQAALDGVLPSASELSELHETYAVTRAAALDAKGGQ